MALFSRGGTSGGITALNAKPYVVNFDPARLTNYRAGRAKQANGVRNCKIGLLGDSAPLSLGASATANQQAVNAMDAQLSKLFTAAGIKSGYQAALGGHNVTSLANWDSRVSQGAFVYSGGFNLYTLGGDFLISQGAATYSFTPNVNCDTADCYYISSPTQGTLSKQVDAGTATNVSANDTEALRKTTLTTTLGAHTFKLNWVSGTISVLGFECYDSSTKQVSLLNMGWSGSTAQQWADATLGYAPRNAISLMGLDLAIITLGFNDFAFNSRSLSQIQADITNLVTSVQAANCDVILVGYVPLNPTAGSPYNVNVSYAQQQSINGAMQAVALAKGCPFIDMFNRWGGAFPANNTAGLMYDDLHKNGPGCGDLASVLFNLLAYT